MFPTFRDFLEVFYGVANSNILPQTSYLLWTCYLNWRHSVGYQGIEPRYLRVYFIRTITPICSIPIHLSMLTCVIYRCSYYSIAHIKKPFQP
jgi:hypothetical protein